MKRRVLPRVPPPADLSRQVTTRTIAQAAGVNAATVSRALRRLTSVSQETRDRIRAIAKRLGYRPNPFVAAFTAQVRTYRSHPAHATIALLDCWPEERPVWASFDDSIDYIGGIRERADAIGYQVERIRLIDLENSLERLQRLLATRRIYGLLVLPVPEDTDLSGLDFSCLACATIDFSLQQPLLIRRVSPNYYQNVWMVLTQLADRGYQRIGFAITPTTTQAQNNLGLAAFLAFGHYQPNLCVAPCLAHTATYQRDLANWIRRERPDALVSSSFRLPDDVVSVGYRVPEEVAAVWLCRPPVPYQHGAHIDENYCEVGAQAVDLIVDAIHRNEFGLPKTRMVHLVDGFWHEGATVRPPEPKPGTSFRPLRGIRC